MLRSLRTLSLTAVAAGLLAVPVTAQLAAPAPAQAAKKAAKKSAKKKSSVKYPTITKISPRKLAVGEKLTIRGKNFRPGKKKSSVAFYRKGQPVIFVKADQAWKTKLVVTVPAKVIVLLAKRDNAPVATQLRLRVIAKKMGKRWTKNSRSPVVSAGELAAAVQQGGGGANSQQVAAAQAYQDCQKLAASNGAGDNDSDGLVNSTELAYKLDPCNADSDGDSMIDGYEFFSAIDLNGTAYPYPGKRPWPNPLDPTDVDYDFDGDWLFLHQEYALWKASGTGFPLRAYSDGTQNSGGTQPVTTVAQGYLDLDEDGNLTDDERDVDNDGLSNVIELNFRGTQEWWKGFDWIRAPHSPGTTTTYVEPAYYLRAFSNLDATDADSDGDGILDGADDQDNDGWSNFAEMQLDRSQVGYRVHPYNPCLPDPHARVCSRYVFLDGDRWAPFDIVDPTTKTTSQMPGDAIPFGWNGSHTPVLYSDWVTAGSPNQYTGSVFGPWDPSPWFSAAWDGNGGPQGA